MKPSIGRIVHVSWYGQRVPATITRIWSDTEVDVCLLAHLDCNPELGFGWKVRSSRYEEETPESAATANSTTISHAAWTWPPRVS